MAPKPLPTPLPTPLIPTSLDHHSTTPSQWFTLHPRIARLCVGALIFRYNITTDPVTSAKTTTPQILLIKRAASDFLPNLWEIPGGSVESNDETLLHAVVREVWEETGLLVREINAQVWDLRVGEKRVVKMGKGDSDELHGKMEEKELVAVVGEKPGEGEVEFLGGKGEVWCKLNFVVDAGNVGEGEVVLDEEEHQDWGWFGRYDILEDGEKGKGLRREFISEQAVQIVERGFEAFEKLETRGK
ncbi:hypothetical protein ONS95_003049 [Cadophora gregata]|uniref:uncharacterized protein n=1 Tax=Cadophora gregata TaxID=51156 RepID=UPI0026DCF2F8|nr:uncharacterized protein ONS95_003049 [Cadophora gregata]KAK0108229.1 hypothetical protein ONS95_003049 [Cadophora gregata]KAK0109179.1 hypothetical protein ONS96_003002 [Cadophora gregata f. sp. sojae]